MDIQDLGAIGEFISSVVIIVTLAVLIYQVRGSTLEASGIAGIWLRRTFAAG